MSPPITHIIGRESDSEYGERGERPIIVLSLYNSYNIERKRYLWRERKIPIIPIIGEESKTRPRIMGGRDRCKEAVIGREKDTYYRTGE